MGDFLKALQPELSKAFQTFPVSELQLQLSKDSDPLERGRLMGSFEGGKTADTALYVGLKRSQQGGPSPASQFVWVLVSGLSTPAKVSWSGFLDVYDLCKSVKELVAPLLDGVPPVNMRVFLNKGEQPLQPDQTISSADSNTVRNALRLEYSVPAKISFLGGQTDQQGRPVVIPLAADTLEGQFAAALEAAQVVNDTLITDKGSLRRTVKSELWSPTTLYIRACYVEIVDLMFARGWPARMALLGSSGIGKSNMLVYLMWRRWQDKELSNFPVYVHQKDNIVKFQKGKLPCRVWPAEVNSAPLKSLFVRDAAGVDNVISANCCALWITSSRRGKLGSEHFKCAEVFNGLFIMPPFSYDEMCHESAMKLHGISKEMIQERFGRFGGSARMVLASTEAARKQFDTELEEAVSSPGALRSLDVSYTFKDISAISHMLVKLCPEEGREFSWSTVKLSSPYVSRELVKWSYANYALRGSDLWDRIHDLANAATAISLYKDAWHYFVQQDVPWFELKCRRPGSTETKKRRFKGNLTGELMVGAAKVVKDGIYYQPRPSYFAAFDSWSREGGFQVTMGLSDEIRMKGSGSQPRAVLKALQACFPSSPVPYFFIVPFLAFLHGFKTNQPVRGGRRAQKGKEGDEGLSEGTEDEEGSSEEGADEEGPTAAIEQWVCCFDRETFDGRQRHPA